MAIKIIHGFFIVLAFYFLLGCSSGPAIAHQQTEGLIPTQVVGIDDGKPLKKGENRFLGYITYNYFDGYNTAYEVVDAGYTRSYANVYHFPKITMGGDLLFSINKHISLGLVGTLALSQKEVLADYHEGYLGVQKRVLSEFQVGGVIRGVTPPKKVTAMGSFQARYGLTRLHEFTLYVDSTSETETFPSGYLLMAATGAVRLSLGEVVGWYNGAQFKTVLSPFYLNYEEEQYSYYVWSYSGMAYSGFDFELNKTVALYAVYALPFGGILKENDIPLNHTVSMGISFNWWRKKYRTSTAESPSI